HGEKAFRSRNFHRLTVDNPVTNHLFGAAEVSLRKLVVHLRNIGVTRSVLVHEYAEGHLDRLQVGLGVLIPEGFVDSLEHLLSPTQPCAPGDHRPTSKCRIVSTSRPW